MSGKLGHHKPVHKLLICHCKSGCCPCKVGFESMISLNQIIHHSVHVQIPLRHGNSKVSFFSFIRDHYVFLWCFKSKVSTMIQGKFLMFRVFGNRLVIHMFSKLRRCSRKVRPTHISTPTEHALSKRLKRLRIGDHKFHKRIYGFSSKNSSYHRYYYVAYYVCSITVSKKIGHQLFQCLTSFRSQLVSNTFSKQGVKFSMRLSLDYQ